MVLTTIVSDEYSIPFFDAAREGRLLLRYSPSRDEWSEPAARYCAITQATDLCWREASGYGKLISWTVKPSRTRGEEQLPEVVLGIVELEEGPWLTVWIPDVNSSAL